MTEGRMMRTPVRSAWNCISRLLATAPPSTRISVEVCPVSAAMARTTSSTSKAIASSAARVMCAEVVPRVMPTIVPRA